ncbi:MAG: hypothetical protein AB1394_16145 [Bacteroidota bacterium]
MIIYDLEWNADEKKVARSAFDKAYQREIEEIKNALKEKVTSLQNEKDVWTIHDYLSKRRNLADKKYDYRYSQLILVFSQLMREGYLTEADLFGLSDDKIEIIKNLADNK